MLISLLRHPRASLCYYWEWDIDSYMVFTDTTGGRGGGFMIAEHGWKSGLLTQPLLALSVDGTTGFSVVSSAVEQL